MAVGFEFMVAEFSELPLGAASDQEVESLTRRLLRRFWPERPPPAELDLDSDAFGEWFSPRIGTRHDLARFETLMKDHRPLATHGVPWKTAVLEQNEQYLDRHFGSMRGLQREFEREWNGKELREKPVWPFGPAYTTTMLGLVLVIQERAGQPKLVFVLPFSQ
jgi:hypothetical protein